jgi:hypothetical protein
MEELMAFFSKLKSLFSKDDRPAKTTKSAKHDAAKNTADLSGQFNRVRDNSWSYGASDARRSHPGSHAGRL